MTVEVKEYAPVVVIDGRRISLSACEHRLLRLLYAHEGKLVSRQALLRDAWDWTHSIDTRAVDAAVSRLRRKLPMLSIVGLRQHGYGIVQVVQ